MSYVISAVIAAVISGTIAFLASERRLASENVIQERAKWRECIRELAEQVYKAFISKQSDEGQFKELRAKLALRLNPHDLEDQQILALVAPGNAFRADEFNQRVSLLLKHDWERTTWESNLVLFATRKEPERAKFQEFRPGDDRSYRRWRFTRRGETEDSHSSGGRQPVA